MFLLSLIVFYSILINGSPSKPFNPARLLKQGDPLSPYLFLICANVLSCAFLKQEASKHLKGIKIGRANQPLSHLLFADESFIFFKNDESSPQTIQNTLAWYYSLSGHSINLEKFKIYCSPNMIDLEKSNLTSLLGVKLVPSPGKYLGINFKLRRNRITDFQDLINKITNKLQGWKAKLLSQAGRFTLINSVSIQCQSTSQFLKLQILCKKLDSIIHAFWWGRGGMTQVIKKFI